jgi:hypothetical protein
MTAIAATVSRRGSRWGGTRTAPLRGFLQSLPRVGAPIILLAPGSDGTVARLITSLVVRVLSDPDGALFAETRQSVYRVQLDQPIAELPPVSRSRVSFDGYELTVAPGVPSDDDADGLETDG